jgi:hypothetical protein
LPLLEAESKWSPLATGIPFAFFYDTTLTIKSWGEDIAYGWKGKGSTVHLLTQGMACLWPFW